MPIGVPRIIYCWGEELPAQWTDIYNFIFRRRMVFLMQYLDDELCNQICGLLINIHMEDRSKELEKKEMERSGVFKGSTKTTNAMSRSDERKGVDALSQREGTNASFYNKKSRSMEDLLNADEDLGIDDIDTLEQYTLQKITTEWLNWNAQFFDYSDEPYLFYLAELLSKDFSSSFPPGQQERGSKSQNNVSTYSSFPYGTNQTDGQTEDPNQTEISAVGELLNMLKNTDSLCGPQKGSGISKGLRRQMSVGGGGINKANMQMGEVYSPFRTNTNFSLFQKESFNNLSSSSIGVPKEGKKQKLLEMFQNYQNFSAGRFNNSFDYTRRGKEAVSPFTGMNVKGGKQRTNSLYKSSLHKGGVSTGLNQTIYNLLSNLAHKDLDLSSSLIQEKVLGQKNLRRSFALENQLSSITSDWDQMNSFNAMSDRYEEGGQKIKSFNYLNSGNMSPGSNAMSEFRDYYRKQTERALIEEESKKVFVIINSFGGSVGNGVTVHDALQFIKAGSLTLALGVAASAASLVLAGGTIGERYVTEGCHVMMHQPEGGLQGQASDIWIDSQEIMKIRLDVAEIYSLSTYRPRHKILRDLDRDFYLTATETIQYGLADEIATNDTMKEIINMTSQVWDYHDSKQQRLLESRESASSGLDTQTQN